MVIKQCKQVLSCAVIPVLGMMVLLVAVTICSVPSSAQEQNYTLGDDGTEDLVLAVYAGRNNLSPGFFALQSRGNYYLPLGELSDVLGFHVELDQNRRVAEGWALDESKRYSIDSDSRVVRYNGQSATLPSEAILETGATGDDIYLLIDVYEEIWPAQFEVDLGALVLRVIPDKELPFERLLERKKRQKTALDNRAKKERERLDNLPFIPYPYQAFGKPSIDFETSFGYDARLNNPEYSFSFNGVQDLAYASADYSLSLAERGGTFNQPDNLRLRFRRQNIHEGALPFGLEDTQWGDVRLQNRDLIANGLSGRGFIFSTRDNNNRSGEFDLITVDGTGIPGWETELYINNELIDFGVVDERGEYRFEDVSIRFGNNRIRVVLYGPQGQVRERVENYVYQQNMVRPGENEFSGGIVDSQQDLISIDRRTTAESEGLAANVYGARGVSKNLTVFASANTVKDDDEGGNTTRRYLSTGAIGAFKNTLAQVEAYQELGAGRAVDIRTLSDFKGFKINARAALYSDFESPDAQNGELSREREFELSVRKVVDTPAGSLGLEVASDYLRRRNDTTTTSHRTRQSLAVKGAGARITHQTTTNLVDGSHSTSTGSLLSTTRKDGWRLRNSLNYTIFPDADINSTQFELRYGRNRDFSTAFTAGRNFDTQETILGTQISRDFGKFLGSAEADWSSAFGWSFLLRASTSIGPYGPDGAYQFQKDPLRNAGPVTSFVYVDKDYDGVFGEGDEPVEKAKIVVNRRTTQDETDEEGRITEINGIVSGRTNVTVSENSIEDPYLVPAGPGYSIFPRPGVMHSVEFPLIETGAIDGTVRWQAGGKPIAGLVLQLMDSDANIIQESKTATDGYFTFERVPPGSYTIRADPESGVNVPFKYVDLTPNNLFQFGQDINVVDLNAQPEEEFGVGVGDDGLMSVKNIVSIAKGFKDRQRAKRNAVVRTPSAGQPPKNKKPSTAQIKGGPSFEAPAVVKAVRVGEHPDKIRVVLDLSGPTNYTLNYDPQSNSIFVEMPYATWSARTNWKSKSGNILDNYQTETLSTSGSRLILGVEDGIKIGASGLLKANGDKQDRLYIDIEKQ